MEKRNGERRSGERRSGKRRSRYVRLADARLAVELDGGCADAKVSIKVKPVKLESR
jgi:hypothetical protein